MDPAAKAFAKVVDGKMDPAGWGDGKGETSPWGDWNTNLKLMLTSAGLMTESAPGQLQAYQELKDSIPKAPEAGVLYLLDAKIPTLQYPVLNQEEVKDKTMSDLANNGYAGVMYTLREKLHYSNGHLGALLPEGGPVYLSYLEMDFNYSGTSHWIIPSKIMLAEGYFDGTHFQAKRIDGTYFDEKDYEEKLHYNADENQVFKSATEEDFTGLMAKLKTIYSCGGVTWRTVKALTTFEHFGGYLNVKPSRNHYGETILECVKSGSCVYVGQSAGTVALSYNVGGLTSDPSKVKHEIHNGSFEDEDFASELGHDMHSSVLAQNLNMPRGLVFRPHLRFDGRECHYSANVEGLQKLHDETELVPYLRARPASKRATAPYPVFAAIMSDYDFPKGKGDCIEMSNGIIKYHVGATDGTYDLSAECVQRLQNIATESGTPAFESQKTQPSKCRIQPDGNGERSFTWTPSDDEIYAAGPKAEKPFRVYASSKGPMEDGPLCP